MDTKQLGQLILYIVFQVEDLDGFTTTIRLVKFLYLMDLEHQRRFGRTLTDLKWFYHLFGPYAFELREIGVRLGFDLEREEFVTAKGHRGTLLHVREPQAFPAGLGYATEVMINGLLQVWADQETSDLLQYVYYGTEPMRNAKRGDRLDFSVVPSGTRYYELYVPVQEDRARKLRDSLRSYAESDGGQYVRPTTVRDDILKAGLSALDDDESPIPDMSGVSFEIDPSNLPDTLPDDS